jgi:hypothetical protein
MLLTTEKNFNSRISGNSCALHLQHKDPIKFWKEISKISNSKAATHVNCIGSANGDKEVVNLWQDHFDHIYIIVIWMKSLVICFMREFPRLPTLVTSVYEWKM